MFRCDADGLNLFQLSEHGEEQEKGGYYGVPTATMKSDGTGVYGGLG